MLRELPHLETLMIQPWTPKDLNFELDSQDRITFTGSVKNIRAVLRKIKDREHPRKLQIERVMNTVAGSIIVQMRQL